MQRIHIVGCSPRSGTTLLAEMMLICFDIDVSTRHEDRIHTWPHRRGKIFLTKKPRDILVAKSVLSVMRNLHIIYLVRDPRDIIVSRHGKEPDRYWSGLEYWQNYTPYGRELRGHPRFVEIQYEDLVSRPDEVQQVIQTRIPFLEEKAKFSRYHELARPSDESRKALKGVRPVSPSSIGRWRRHKPRVAGQIQLNGSISADLIAFGYEKDEMWEKELEGVEPDLRDSHLTGLLTEKSIRKYRRAEGFRAWVTWMGHHRIPLEILKRLKKIFWYVYTVVRR